MNNEVKSWKVEKFFLSTENNFYLQTQECNYFDVTFVLGAKISK